MTAVGYRYVGAGTTARTRESFLSPLRELVLQDGLELPLFGEESLERVLEGGGSGALVYVIKDGEQRRVRKLMRRGGHDDGTSHGEIAQNLEARGGAVLQGHELARSGTVAAKVLARPSSREALKRFVDQTRPVVRSRFVVVAPGPQGHGGAKRENRRVGVGYDQDLVPDASTLSEAIQRAQSPREEAALARRTSRLGPLGTRMLLATGVALALGAVVWLSTSFL